MDEAMIQEAELRHEIAQLSTRVASLENQYQTTLLSVLKGLKGSDDGDGLGLYERVRSISTMQQALMARFETWESNATARIVALEKAYAEHAAEKQAVIFSGKALWFVVVAVSGMIAFLVSLMK